MRTIGDIWHAARATPRRRVVGEAVATGVVGLLLVAIGLVGTRGTGAQDLPSRWLFVLPLACACLLLLAKRSHPGWAALISTIVLVVDQVMGGSVGVVIAYFDLIYCVAFWGTREVLRRAQLLTAAAVLAAGAIPFVVTGDLRESALLGIVVFTLLGAPLWWGQSVRTQAELARAAAERSEDQRRIAELREATVLQEERTRMARELHDALAYNLAAISIHAEAHLARPDDGRDPVARRSLAAIRHASVGASDELRAMVLLLRSGDDERTAPARLADVGSAVEQARHRGLDVTLYLPATPPDLLRPSSITPRTGSSKNHWPTRPSTGRAAASR